MSAIRNCADGKHLDLAADEPTSAATEAARRDRLRGGMRDGTTYHGARPNAGLGSLSQSGATVEALDLAYTEVSAEQKKELAVLRVAFDREA